MINIKKIFTGGINSDDDERLIDDDSYLNAMDARLAISSNGRSMRLESIRGTSELDSEGLLPENGNNFCIGTAVDRARGWLIRFNYNSLGEDGIYAYDPANGIGYKVILSSDISEPLNFSKSSRINRNAKVIGDLLYWTDNNNQPRKVNYIAGIKTLQPSFDTDVAPYTLPIDYKVIAWVKSPPIYPLIFEKQTDTGFTANLTQDETFFFVYQYVYRDNEYSPLSMFSDLCPFNAVPNYYIGGSTQAYGIRISVSADTYNNVFISVPYTEKIPQDVQQINIYVRYGENGVVSLIKNYNKEISADATAIANHNASVTQDTFLSFNFFNNIKGVTLGDSEIVENDGTPLAIKTIEAARDRIFGADILSGYDAPTTTSLAVTSSTQTMTDSLPTFHSYRSFRAGSKYKPCVSFYDEYKRKCGCIPIDEYLMPNYVDFQPLASTPTINSTLNWTLNNAAAATEIPDWAYYYSIDLTKDLSVSSFLTTVVQGGDGISYAIKNSDNTYTYTGLYDQTRYAVIIKLILLNREGQGYVYNEGDYCILSSADSSTVHTLKILQVDGQFLFLELADVGFLPQNTNAYKAMIVTPRVRSVDEPYYERGQIYNVTNPTESGRQYETLNGSVLGDIYAFALQYSYWSSKHLIYESMSPNTRQWKRWETNIGFANFNILLGQQELKTTVPFSNKYINGTRTNGLSRFEPLNRKDIGNTSGSIQNLILTNKKEEDGTVMLIITENEVLSAYLSEVQLVGAASNADVATSSEVIGTINALKLNSGTANPESVFEYMGIVFWFDGKNGWVSQYSSNGVGAVSDFKMNRFFKNYAANYQATSQSVINTINGFSHICMCIDPFQREVLVTLPALIYENYAQTLPSYSSVPPYATSIINRFDISDSLGKTMTFDFEKNKWRANYSMMAEWSEYVDNQLYLFKNGAMYSHSTNQEAYNTYFGVQYPLRLCAVWNMQKEPSAIKTVSEIALEASVQPDFSVLYSPSPNLQITDLSADDDWENLEGVWYASWFCDRLSPNVSGTPDEKLYTGDEMISPTPMFMGEWQQNSELMFINFIQIGFQVSRGQKMILNK